ncbi:MAG: SDR family NAD(P)-dependent oxidoreductase, partial [Ensifer adhaerens]
MAHVIITGGSSGIGFAVASIYAARGARLSLIARSRGLLEGAQAKLIASSGANADSIRIEAADVAVE